MTDITEYLAKDPKVLDEAAISAMTDDEFAEALRASEDGPVIISAINPETGEEMRAYALPVSMIDAALAAISARAAQGEGADLPDDVAKGDG